MNRFALILGCLSIVNSGAVSAGGPEAVCAVVSKAGRGLQVIPEKGRVMTDLPVDSGVPCGSMVLTHEAPVWIKLSDQTVVKLGPRSFIEVPQVESRNFRMYRGAIMLSAPASLISRTWSTPNSEIDFKGGVVVLQYIPEERVSIAGCFNRKVEFRNKFNSNAVQELSAGEMSRLAIQEGRVAPTHPAILHPASVGNVLASLGLESAEQEQVVAIVKQVYQDRSRSLVADIQDWSGSEGPTRSIASIPQSSKSTIDPKESALTMKLLKDRLYGTDEEQGRYVPAPVGRRSPASIRDEHKEKAVNKLKTEVRRIGKEIDRMDPDSKD
ncbi:MAG: hypothetical protein KGP28_12680 [Bdellovibrionales bacterium]|nr:hypothetical protein [Bdellovibrionales bacterium]